MAEGFSRVAILGLGLMGGSLALALRAAGLAAQLSGYDALLATMARALALGVIDEPAASPAQAVAQADLVVLAAPVGASGALLAALRTSLAPDALVTDLGSTKAQVVAWATETLLDPARFVGGHPMTGSERSGVEAASATLYGGITWCLTPTAQTAPHALERMRGLVVALGAHPLELSPDRHDHLVAGASHLPLLAATALVQAVTGGGDWPDLAQLAASGFRDTTRVASGDPVMARDICLTNRAEIVGWLDSYLTTLHTLRAQVAAGAPDALEASFRAARDARDAWLREHEARGYPPGRVAS